MANEAVRNLGALLRQVETPAASGAPRQPLSSSATDH